MPDGAQVTQCQHSCKGRLPSALGRVDGLNIIDMVLEGEENIWLSTGNETFVMRNYVCSNQHIKLNLRMSQVMWVKPVFAFLGFFGTDTFNIKRSKYILTI